MRKRNVLMPLVVIFFLIFIFVTSGISGLIGYLALFVIGITIGFIIREIRRLRGGRK